MRHAKSPRHRGAPGLPEEHWAIKRVGPSTRLEYKGNPWAPTKQSRLERQAIETARLASEAMLMAEERSRRWEARCREYNVRQEHLQFWTRVDEALLIGRACVSERVATEEDMAGRQQAEALKLLRAERKRTEQMVQIAEQEQIVPLLSSLRLASEREMGELRAHARAQALKVASPRPPRDLSRVGTPAALVREPPWRTAHPASARRSKVASRALRKPPSASPRAAWAHQSEREPESQCQ